MAQGLVIRRNDGIAAVVARVMSAEFPPRLGARFGRTRPHQHHGAPVLRPGCFALLGVNRRGPEINGVRVPHCETADANQSVRVVVPPVVGRRYRSAPVSSKMLSDRPSSS